MLALISRLPILPENASARQRLPRTRRAVKVQDRAAATRVDLSEAPGDVDGVMVVNFHPRLHRAVA